MRLPSVLGLAPGVGPSAVFWPTDITRRSIMMSAGTSPVEALRQGTSSVDALR